MGYTYQSICLDKVLQVDILARSTRDPVPGSLELFDKPDSSDTVKKATLARDAALGGMMVGQLAAASLPSSPSGELKFFLEDKELADVWIAVTWGK